MPVRTGDLPGASNGENEIIDVLCTLPNIFLQMAKNKRFEARIFLPPIIDIKVTVRKMSNILVASACGVALPLGTYLGIETRLATTPSLGRNRGLDPLLDEAPTDCVFGTRTVWFISHNGVPRRLKKVA